MEYLLGYLITSLFRHNVTNVITNSSPIMGKTWTVVFENQVYITFGETDLNIIRRLYKKNADSMYEYERERYMKIFNICK